MKYYYIPTRQEGGPDRQEPWLLNGYMVGGPAGKTAFRVTPGTLLAVNERGDGKGTLDVYPSGDDEIDRFRQANEKLGIVTSNQFVVDMPGDVPESCITEQGIRDAMIELDEDTAMQRMNIVVRILEDDLRESADKRPEQYPSATEKNSVYDPEKYDYFYAERGFTTPDVIVNGVLKKVSIPPQSVIRIPKVQNATPVISFFPTDRERIENFAYASAVRGDGRYPGSFMTNREDSVLKYFNAAPGEIMRIDDEHLPLIEKKNGQMLEGNLYYICSYISRIYERAGQEMDDYVTKESLKEDNPAPFQTVEEAIEGIRREQALSAKKEAMANAAPDKTPEKDEKAKEADRTDEKKPAAEEKTASETKDAAPPARDEKKKFSKKSPEKQAAIARLNGLKSQLKVCREDGEEKHKAAIELIERQIAEQKKKLHELDHMEKVAREEEAQPKNRAKELLKKHGWGKNGETQEEQKESTEPKEEKTYNDKPSWAVDEQGEIKKSFTLNRDQVTVSEKDPSVCFICYNPEADKQKGFLTQYKFKFPAEWMKDTGDGRVNITIPEDAKEVPATYICDNGVDLVARRSMQETKIFKLILADMQEIPEAGKDTKPIDIGEAFISEERTGVTKEAANEARQLAKDTVLALENKEELGTVTKNDITLVQETEKEISVIMKKAQELALGDAIKLQKEKVKELKQEASDKFKACREELAAFYAEAGVTRKTLYQDLDNMERLQSKDLGKVGRDAEEAEKAYKDAKKDLKLMQRDNAFPSRIVTGLKKASATNVPINKMRAKIEETRATKTVLSENSVENVEYTFKTYEYSNNKIHYALNLAQIKRDMDRKDELTTAIRKAERHDKPQPLIDSLKEKLGSVQKDLDFCTNENAELKEEIDTERKIEEQKLQKAIEALDASGLENNKIKDRREELAKKLETAKGRGSIEDEIKGTKPSFTDKLKYFKERSKKMKAEQKEEQKSKPDKDQEEKNKSNDERELTLV